MLNRQVAEAEDFEPSAFPSAREVAGKAWVDGAFPCVAVFARRHGVAGTALICSPEPVGAPLHADALFDLASLTKPLATTLLALRAMEAGSLRLDDSLARLLPEASGGRNGATVADLLSHRAGLPPVPDLHRFFPDSLAVDRDEACARLLAVPCDRPPGEEMVYSCTGFLLLGLALERIGGLRLALLFEREIARPLGLSPSVADSPSVAAAAGGARKPGMATFRPSADLLARTVPTELCPWRGRRVRGEVHDESSFCLGGDGGNAGLFADLAGTAALFSVYEDGGSLLKPETVAAARGLWTAGLSRRRGLGLQLHDAETCDGPSWPADSYGHTGFTGTSAWRSPSLDLTAIALTNRVYYGRAATADRIAEFRLAFHGALAAPVD